MSTANKTTVLEVKDPPYGPGHLYCATSSDDGVWIGGGTYGTISLFFTRDGVRFEKRTAPELYQHRALLALPDGTLLAGGQYGLMRSKDGGKKWSEVKSFAKKGAEQCWHLALGDDGTIWGSSDGVIAWSKDAVKWSHLSVPKSGGFDWIFAKGDRTFALFEKNLFVIRNGKLEARKAMPKALWGMASAPNGTMLVVGDGGLVMRSEDGLKWQQSKSPAKAKLAAVAWCTDRFIIAGEDGTLLSTVDGKSFTKLSGAAGIEGCSVTPFGTGALIGGVRDDKGVVLRIGEPVKAAKAGTKRAAAERVATKPMPPRRKRALTAASVKKKRIGLADVERTTMAKVGKEFGLARKVGFDLSPNDPVFVYRGDLVVDRFETPAKAKVVVVDGHLVIDGGLDLAVHEDDDAYLLLLVTGNLSAGSVWISGDPLVQIGGDAEIEDVLVVGEGNAIFEVAGTLSSRAVFALPQGNVRAKKIDALVVGEKARLGKGKVAIAYGLDGVARVLQDKYISEDGRAEMRALRAPLKKGAEVLRKELEG